MQITVLKRSDGDIIAYLNNDQKRWGWGRTADEAIGDVIRSHAADLHISIDLFGEKIGYKEAAITERGIDA